MKNEKLNSKKSYIEILFLGLLFKEGDENEMLSNSKVGLNNSCNTLQWNIIKGIKKNDVNVKIINSIPCGNYPRLNKKLFIRSKDWILGTEKVLNKEIGFINFYIIKHFIRKIKYYREILKWINYNKNVEKYIVLYDMYIPFLKCIRKIKKLNNETKICLIVGDLPNEYGHNYEKFKHSLKNIFLRYRGKKSIELTKHIDSYVLLTEYMKYPLKITDKPYAVIEGIVDINRECHLNKSVRSDKKIIMYTGILNKQYGIRALLEAFSNIEDKSYELWLCGSGDLNEYIKTKSMEDNRIKFFGYVSKSKLLELEKDITVYINPRINEGEYTKYSFPSKTMEYLASGKPTIMYKLDGIPNDYDEHLFYVEGNSINDLKNKIVDVCNKNKIDLYEIGIKAREFVMNKKNCTTQAKKIYNLFLN